MTLPRKDCPTEEQLLEFVEGRTGGDARDRVDHHLGDCDECAALVAEIAHEVSRAAPPSEGGDGGALEPSPLAAGDRVGRYVILEELGSGGMGTVYAARDPSLDRDVALKLLKPRAGGPELETRLLREAKAMARLSHPEVVTVFDAGTHGTQLFIAMELVRGGNLREWLAAAPRPWRAILDKYVRAGRGLARAHAAGIVHRDFKPDNVLVDDDGRVRVTDFGLARAARSVEQGASAPGEMDAPVTLGASLTRTGAIVGTPAYMAPEQLEGSPADVRSDVFSFCVALYEALYGEKPFRGATLRQLHRAKVAGEIAPPSPARREGAERLLGALLVGLRPLPADRYASMEVLLSALERAARSSRSRVVVATAVAALVLAAAVIAARATWWRAHVPAASTRPVAAAVTPECAASRTCVDAHAGAPWVCRAVDHTCAELASQDCTPMFEAGDLEADDTVWLGAMLPTKGPQADVFGTIAMRGIDFARHEIGQATKDLEESGATIRARRIALVACDDSEEPMRAARHLVDDVGVSAVLGLSTGPEAVDVAGGLLVKRGVLAIASVTSNPLVTRVPQPAGPRLVWRTTYSGDQVGGAAARILGVLESKAGARLGATRIVLARSDDAVGASFGEAFFRSLSFNDKPAVANGTGYQEIAFPPRVPSPAELRAITDKILAAEPTFVALASTPLATVPIVDAVESRWRAGAARPTFLVAPGSTEQFAPFLGTSADRRRRLFAIQSLSDSMPNARFVIRYNQAHPDAPVSREINPSADYDAFYLVAYAALALGDQAPTGASLATAFGRLLPPGDPIEVGPTGVYPALQKLSAGGRFDLAGAQSALDFDVGTGETPSDFALLCAAVDRRGRASGEDVESGVVYRAATGAIEGTPRCP